MSHLKKLSSACVFLWIFLFKIQGIAHYRISPGDTLSQIAKIHLGSPIYTKEGSLKRLLTLNPHIKNPDLIHAGQIVVLDSKSPQPVSKPQTPLKPRGPAQLEGPPLSESSESLARSSKTGHLPEKPSPNSEEESLSNDLFFSYGFSYGKYDLIDASNSSQASLITDVNTQFNLSWSLGLSERINSLLEFKTLSENLRPLADTNRELSQTKNSRSEVSLFLGYNLNQSLNFGVGFWTGENLYFRSVSTAQIVAEKNRVEGLSARLNFDFMRYKTLDSFFRYRFSQFQANNKLGYQTKAGNKSTFTLGIKNQSRKIPIYLGASIFWSMSSQDTEYSQVKAQDIGLDFSIGSSF